MPDAEVGYHRLLDLFQELKDETDLGDSREEMEEAQEGEAEQSGRQDGQQVQAPAIDLSPDEDEGDDEEDDESEEDKSGGGSQSGEEDEESEDDSSGSSDGDGEDEEEDEDENSESESDSQSGEESDEELPSVGSVEDQIDEDDVDELVDETEVDPNDSDGDEIDQIESELKGAGAGEDDIKTPDPKDFPEEQNIIRRAEQRSRYLKRVVEDHFEPTKGNAVNRDRTHGNFDSTRMVSAARGSPRCFKTEDNPEKPDFQVVIAVDASGSMDNDGMSEAAEAATMAAKAFEDAGGDVYAYRFGIYAELIKTPSMSYDESKSALSSLDTTGATSLLPVLEKYHDLSQGVKNSFLFVITDGMPSYDELCKKELRDIEDPTACLQYDEYGNGFGDDYDAFQVIKNSDEIQEKSTSLIRRLVERGGASL
jgi:Mg-chelatase subunit ChlD